MSSKSQRLLRHNVSCTPLANIFKNQKYVMNSCQHLPEDVYNKVSKIHALTCDEINSLTFNRKDPHDRVLLKMQEALQLQTKKVYNRSPDRFMNRYERRQEDDSLNSMGGIRIIQSEDQDLELEGEEILLHPCFRSELQNMIID